MQLREERSGDCKWCHPAGNELEVCGAGPTAAASGGKGRDADIFEDFLISLDSLPQVRLDSTMFLRARINNLSCNNPVHVKERKQELEEAVMDLAGFGAAFSTVTKCTYKFESRRALDRRPIYYY